jgi:hypothetical protein
MPRAKKDKAGMQRLVCSICQEDFHPKAFTSHFKKCQRMQKAEEGLEEYERHIMEKWYSNPSRMCPFTSFFNMADILFPARSDFDDDNINTDADYLGAPSSLDPPTQLETPLPQSIISMPIPFLTSHAQAGPASPADVTDDAATSEIRTEYHPRSRRPAKVSHFDSGYGASTQRQRPTPSSWWPFFRSREDFLIAEILLKSHLPRDESDMLIKLIDACVNGKGLFTLKGILDVEAAWDRASLKLAPVSLRAKSTQKC